MAASTASLAPINDTDANFRLWGKAISDALLAGGMVKTADTGQIDWATVTRPTVINTAQGYEIWRSNDGGSGLNNFYFKIEYGAGAAVNTPATWLTVGWGSNGSGTITGNASTRTLVASTASSASTFFCNFAVATNYAVISMFSNSNYFFFSIERTRTIAGAEEDQLFLWFKNSSATPLVNQVIPRVGVVQASVVTQAFGVRSLSVTNATYGSDIGVSTIAPQKGGWLMEAMNFFGGDSTNFPTSQALYSFTVYGALRTYIAHGSAGGLDGSAIRILSRYE